MSEGSNGFGGFTGLFATRVRITARITTPRVFVVEQQKERRLAADASHTPVPNDPAKSAESFRTLGHRCLRIRAIDLVAIGYVKASQHFRVVDTVTD